MSGGRGDYIHDRAEAMAAKTEYIKACTQYREAMNKLTNLMNSVTDSWRDGAGDEWIEIVKKAKAELEKNAEDMEKNRGLTEAVSQAAADAQSVVQSQIHQLY